MFNLFKLLTMEDMNFLDKWKEVFIIMVGKQVCGTYHLYTTHT